MKTLIVGGGAREHAIAWKLSTSSVVTELLVAPGNAGTAQLARNISIRVEDIDKLLHFALDEQIDLTVVGPELPLANGISDRFKEAGLALFGPIKNAALIESSKHFAKDLMLKHGVPTGTSMTFESYSEAIEHIQNSPMPVVVKADGLASGKGVSVANTRREACDVIYRYMEQKQLGSAGQRILIEEYMSGREISVFAFVDKEYVSPMVAACDYKRVGEGDVGPNTGGMGSYSPTSLWTENLESQVRQEIMEPVVKALNAMGIPYQGILYAGLMLTSEGPKVVEFNCRLGDPEAQVILPRLKTDLGEVMMRTAQGRLQGLALEWDKSACVGVVLASGGYPDAYNTGYLVEGLGELDEGISVFHAGTREMLREDFVSDEIVTDGGRVLTLSALGETLDEARRKVYSNIGRVVFKDGFYRNDIAACS